MRLDYILSIVVAVTTAACELRPGTHVDPQWNVSNDDAGVVLRVDPPSFCAHDCYFTSYPIGSRHCVTAPCSITNVATATLACTTVGYLNYESGTTIYGAYANGEIVAIYFDAPTTFPACKSGARVNGEPSDPGDYYATGLEVGVASAQEVATFCAP